ncbi:polysaccharide deacetylase family protein [Morganella morganii]|nr:polysaccharide deacetylase family protein [Morganella morganii]
MRNLFFILMVLFSATGISGAAEIPSDSQEWLLKDEPPLLIQVKEPQVIFAPVAGVIQGVAELNPSYGFYIYPMKGEFRELQFGNDRGFVGSGHLSDKKPKIVPPLDTLNELNNPIYDYLITISNTNVFGTPDDEKTPVATLFGDLRYPVLAKMIRENREGEKIVWLTIRLADRLAYIRLSDVELDNGIPILTYHHILKDSENRNFRHTSTTTSVEAFKAQMDYLKQAGYRTISPDDVAGYLEKENNLPGKVVVLTFDDGLKSVYRYAYPILKQNDQKATLFVISSRVKSKPQKWAPDGLQFMCWPELMQSRDTFYIQSHTHFLHRLDNRKNPIIFSRKEHTILLDYQRSQRVLAKLNPQQHYLAYPFGAYNQDAMDAAQQAGMTLAVTTIQGKVRLGDNPYALKRLYALRTDPIDKFATMIGNSGPEVVNKDIVVDR